MDTSRDSLPQSRSTAVSGDSVDCVGFSTTTHDAPPWGVRAVKPPKSRNLPTHRLELVCLVAGVPRGVVPVVGDLDRQLLPDQDLLTLVLQRHVALGERQVGLLRVLCRRRVTPRGVGVGDVKAPCNQAKDMHEVMRVVGGSRQLALRCGLRYPCG